MTGSFLKRVITDPPVPYLNHREEPGRTGSKLRNFFNSDPTIPLDDRHREGKGEGNLLDRSASLRIPVVRPVFYFEDKNAGLGKSVVGHPVLGTFHELAAGSCRFRLSSFPNPVISRLPSGMTFTIE